MRSRIPKATLPRVIKDELPSENSHLTIFKRTVNSYCGGKTTRGDGDSLSCKPAELKFRLAYPGQPMVCFQFVEA